LIFQQTISTFYYTGNQSLTATTTRPPTINMAHIVIPTTHPTNPSVAPWKPVEIGYVMPCQGTAYPDEDATNILHCHSVESYKILAPLGTPFSHGYADDDTDGWLTTFGGGCWCNGGSICCAADAGVDYSTFIPPSPYPTKIAMQDSKALDFAESKGCDCNRPPEKPVTTAAWDVFL
jgi:hypothetical protein